MKVKHNIHRYIREKRIRPNIEDMAKSTGPISAVVHQVTKCFEDTEERERWHFTRDGGWCKNDYDCNNVDTPDELDKSRAAQYKSITQVANSKTAMILKLIQTFLCVLMLIVLSERHFGFELISLF